MWQLLIGLLTYLFLGFVFAVLGWGLYWILRGRPGPDPRPSPSTSPSLDYLCNLCREPLDPNSPAIFIQEDQFHPHCFKALQENLRKRTFCDREVA